MPGASTTPSTPLPLARPRDPALDGLRGLAVLMIFGFHFGGGLHSTGALAHLLGMLTQAGWTGVVLFLALSGFLITGGLWDTLQAHPTQPVLRNFYARRSLRILPLYLATLILVSGLSLARGTPFPQLRPLLLFAFFLQNVPGLTSIALANPSPLPLYHLWSIAVEEQFYLLWPFLLLIAVRRPASRLLNAIRLCLAVCALAFLFRLTVYGLPCLFPANHLLNPLPGGHLFDEFLPTYAGTLALGSALALLLRSHTAPRTLTTVAFFFGLALYLGSSLLSHSLLLGSPLQYIVGLTGVSLAATACIPLALRSGAPRALLAGPVLTAVGRISYGFYIIQVLVQPVASHLVRNFLGYNRGNTYFTLRFLVALVLSLAASWLSFHLLETPFLRLKRRFPMRPPLPPRLDA